MELRKQIPKLSLVYLFFFNPHLRIHLLVLERGRERERNIDVKEKHQLIASHMCPDWGLNLQPRYVPWPRNKPMTFWYMKRCSSQLSHPARTSLAYLKCPSYFWFQFLHWTIGSATFLLIYFFFLHFPNIYIFLRKFNCILILSILMTLLDMKINNLEMESILHRSV